MPAVRPRRSPAAPPRSSASCRNGRVTRSRRPPRATRPAPGLAGRLQLPPDHHRPDAGRAGTRGAGPGRPRHPQPQGLPHLRSLAAHRRAVPGGTGDRAALRRLRDRALRELRRHRLAHPRPSGGRPHRPAPACLGPPAGGRTRGDAPGDRARRTRRPADPGLPRLLRRGGGRDRPGAGAGHQGLGRDLPAIPDPFDRRLGQADFEGAKVVCSPALRRPAKRNGSGPASARAPSTWSPPTIAASPSPPPSAIPAAAATARAAPRRDPTGCRLSTRSRTACRGSRPSAGALFRGRLGRAHRPADLRAPDLDQRRPLFGLAGRKGTLAPGAMPTWCCGTRMPSGS